MAIVLDKTQSRQRIAEIRQLWNEWDPIGVALGDPADDEYNSYLAPTLRLLERDASAEEIVAYLKWVTLEHMALPQIDNPEAFAERLRHWFKSKWEGTRVPGA
jgi:hypothetical protein